LASPAAQGAGTSAGTDAVLGHARRLFDVAERHPRLTFAAVQVLVWGLFYLTQYLSLLPRLMPAERVPFLVLELTMFVTAPVVTTLLHVAFRASSLVRIPGGIAARVALVLLAIWLGSRLWVVIDGSLIRAVVALTPVRFDWARVSGVMGGSYWLTLLAWTGGYFVIQLWRILQERERRLLEFQVSARDAQLRALAYQLNPHFLFNALNSLRALVLEDQGRAREMITRLAAFLRHTLAVPEHGENSVAEELEALRSYLAIEQVRFEERLVVTWDVTPAAEARVVPSLILQPLVENAIRHGGSDADGRVEVRIAASTAGEELRLVVSNTGSMDRTGARAAGMGLENVRSRLAFAFPGRHRVETRENDGWVHVELRMTETPGGGPSDASSRS
jgi:signal transduction histidine kinase